MNKSTFLSEAEAKAWLKAKANLRSQKTFQRIGPLGRFFHRVAMCIYVWMSPPHVFFFQASHWPSDSMISSRPLIGQSSNIQYPICGIFFVIKQSIDIMSPQNSLIKIQNKFGYVTNLQLVQPFTATAIDFHPFTAIPVIYSHLEPVTVILTIYSNLHTFPLCIKSFLL